MKTWRLMLAACTAAGALSGSAAFAIESPKHFDGCSYDVPVGALPTTTNPVVIEKRGSSCFKGESSDYFSIFVRSEPPVTIDLAKNSKKLIKNAEYILLPKAKRGSVVATLSLSRLGASDIPFTILKLADFAIDRKNGLRLTMDKAIYNGPQGYRFARGEDASIKVNIIYAYEKKTDSKISAAITRAQEAARSIGVLPVAAVTPQVTAALAVVGEAAAEIAKAGNKNITLGTLMELSAVKGGTESAMLAYSLGPITKEPGRFFIGIQRRPSILVTDLAEKPGGGFDAGIAAWGTDRSAKILDQFIGGEPLIQLLHADLGDAVDALSSTDPATFEAACRKLTAAVAKPKFGLSGPDQVIAKWAMLAPNYNMTMGPIRDTMCMKAIQSSGEWLRYSLPFPGRDDPVPTAYLKIMQDAQAAADKARQQASLAESAADLAQSHYAQATLPNKPAGFTYKLTGSSSFYGTAPDAENRVSGKFLMLNGDLAGDYYLGQMTVGANGVPRYQGSGRYVFAADRPKGCSAQATPAPGCYVETRDYYVGDFSNNFFDGFGRLKWRDGRVYEGKIVSGMPSGLGVLRGPDGRVQYGQFAAGKLSGMALQVEADGRRIYGNSVDGELSATIN